METVVTYYCVQMNEEDCLVDGNNSFEEGQKELENLLDPSGYKLYKVTIQEIGIGVRECQS
jgi:hypothetical protein